MIEPRIVRRYVAALFASAMKNGVVDAVESDLGLVAYALESSPELVSTMASPLIPASKKRDILGGVFGGKVHEITLSYLHLLVDKRREEAMLSTEREFVSMANEARGIVDARVTSAVQLGADQEAALRAKLSTVTGKNVQLTVAIDPRIIGGLTVQIGDRIMDGSVRGQLSALREELLR